MQTLFVKNWRAVLLRAWSLWLIAAAFALQLGGEIAPALFGVVPGWVVLLLLAASAIARLLKQRSIKP